MLPKLEHPRYKVKLPSTGKMYEFRPFLVKEEKVLLISQESDDPTEQIDAVKNVIKSCLFEKIDVEHLPISDIEYLFLQLRAKSVGEIIEATHSCKNCEHDSNITIDLTKVNVHVDKKVKSKIELSDNIGITLRPVQVRFLNDLENAKDISDTIVPIIDTIYDKENIHKADDVSKEELIEFIDSLSHQDFEKIEKYISSQPILKHDVVYNCSKCETENKITLSGLSDFFA